MVLAHSVTAATFGFAVPALVVVLIFAAIIVADRRRVDDEPADTERSDEDAPV